MTLNQINPITSAVSANPINPTSSTALDRLWSRLVGDSSCYNRLSAKYPGMDSTSKTIVSILCDNQQTSVDTGNEPVYFSNQGCSAIGEALEQNTALKSLCFNQISCLSSDLDCYSTLASALSSVLKINRSLKNLYVGFSSASYSAAIPTQTILHDLPCYNLNSLTINDYLQCTQDGANDFANTIKNNPYFPLESISLRLQYGLPERIGMSQAIGEALGASRCIKEATIQDVLSTDEVIAELSSAIGSSRIAIFGLPDMLPAQFTPEQKQTILDAVANNKCFLNYTRPGSYPRDLLQGIQNLTQGRTPCIPDPRCSIPAVCAHSNPSSDSSSAISTGTALAIAIPITMVGTAALTYLGTYLFNKYRPKDPMEQPLV